MAKKIEKKQPELEKLYEELLRNNQLQWPNCVERYGSLEQPSPFRVVRTVVTYGAYEQPI